MGSKQYATKENVALSTQQHAPPAVVPQLPQVQPQPIEVKSNEEGFAEHAERLRKFQRLGNSMIQMGPPRFDKDMTSSVQPKPLIQRKLTIGDPGDKYEQEADRVASQVVQQINTLTSLYKYQGQSIQTDKEYEGMQLNGFGAVNLRRQAIASGEASTNLESLINDSRGSGQPLNAGLQQSMGQEIRADFSGGWGHTDARANLINQSIKASKITTVQDAIFRQGENTSEGTPQRSIKDGRIHGITDSVIQRKSDKPLPDNEKKAIHRLRGSQPLDQLKNEVTETSGFLKKLVITAKISGEPTKSDFEHVVNSELFAGIRKVSKNGTITMEYDDFWDVLLYNEANKKAWLMSNSNSKLSWIYLDKDEKKERKLMVDNVARGTHWNVGEYDGVDGVETLKGFGVSKLLEFIILPKVEKDVQEEKDYWMLGRESHGFIEPYIESISKFIGGYIPISWVSEYLNGPYKAEMKDHWSELIGGHIINKETVELTKPFLEWYWKKILKPENSKKRYSISKENLNTEGIEGWQKEWSSMITDLQKSPLVVLMVALKHPVSDIKQILEETKITNLSYKQMDNYNLNWPRPSGLTKLIEV